MAKPFEWKLLNPETALKLVPNHPLGSASIDHKPLGLDLQSGLSFVDEDHDARLALNLRGTLTVTVLNDASDPDEDGILGVADCSGAGDSLPPQLILDGDRAYVKYRAEAGLKASGGVAIASLLGFDAGADASAIFADYRAHARDAGARDAVLAALKQARFVTKVEHVLSLEEGDALAFRFGGTLNVAVTVSWSDVFTGQIGTLSKLLGSTAPIAIAVNAGASLALDVRVADEFLIVFSRVSAKRWRAGIRKVQSSRVAPSLDAGIDVGFANPEQLARLVDATLAGLLGAPLDRVETVLAAASLESLSGVERKVAKALIERLGLSEELATIEALNERVKEARARVAAVVDDVVRTRIALSFSYEYNRVSTETNLLQALLDRAAVIHVHGDVIRARTTAIVEAAQKQRRGVEIERYLNEKEVTRTRSFGFTLGFGKWAALGGTDFKKVSTVRRRDLQNRLQESYLGARLYTGKWIGETMQWGVDLKADMKDYAAEPRVNDYSFGIHLLWTAEQDELSGVELEEWLDSAVVWRVLGEQDLVDIRARLAAALDQRASLTVQLVVPNSALRVLLPALSTAPIEAYAPALAVAMPWMKIAPARSSATIRRHAYAPLWSLYLKDPHRPLQFYARAAADHLESTGHRDMVVRETVLASATDPFSFAGLTAINGDTSRACEAFTRAVQVLRTAIGSGARNQKTIDKVCAEMDDLWQQSHHVRAVGAYLLDACDRHGVLAKVTRTMTVAGDGLAGTVVVTA